MELLDVYDELGNHLGTESRSVVHRDALWHKTVHCWLYDEEGNVFFQRRAEENTLYTTASGHLDAGESIEDAFAREIKEELGIEIDASDAIKVTVVNFVLDKVKKDGSVFRDRAFANIYLDKYEGDYQDFKFDPNEVSELVLVNAKEALVLFQKENGQIPGKIIRNAKDKNEIIEREISFEEFLVNKGETALSKYGDVLNKIIETISI